MVHLRLGVVLSAAGGALKKMLPPFRMGLGGVIGNGRQYMSWVSLDDVVGMIRHVLEHDSIHGPVNLVAPHAARNREFTKALGRILHRPTILPLSALVARWVFGEMAQELLLASTRVTPRKLTESGYVFLDPDLKQALA